MTDPYKFKSVSASAAKQSPGAARKSDMHSNDIAGAFSQNPSGLTDVAMLAAEAFASFDEARDEYTAQIDGFTTEDGGESAVSLLLPAVQAAREAAGNAFNRSGEDGVYFIGRDGQIDLDGVGEEIDVIANGSRVAADDIADRSGSDAPSGAGKLAVPPAPVAANVIVGDDGGNDWLIGTNGDDDIYGLAGNDVLIGRNGDDNLFGGAGTDFLFGGRGDDKLWGANGNDYLDAGNGDDKIFAGAGNDTLLGQNGENELYGEGGNDLLVGGVDDDLFDGGGGIDTVSYANAGDPVSVQLWMNSSFSPGQGLDTFVDIENIIGSDFNDTIAGDSGGNRLEGRDGHDRLDGGPGNDYLSGGAGSDGLIGGTGNDIFDGGAGDDYAVFSGSASGVVVDLGWNGPQNTGQGIDSFLSVESVYGSILGDLLRGTNGDNNIGGDAGNDWLWGASGNDELFGGDGNDVLHGGAGTDGLSGDDGVDAFVYGALFGDAGDDYISDFEDGVEKVFVEIGFGISDFSDVTIGANTNGDAVASFTGIFGGSITFSDISADQIGQDDFVFFA